MGLVNVSLSIPWDEGDLDDLSSSFWSPFAIVQYRHTVLLLIYYAILAIKLGFGITDKLC